MPDAFFELDGSRFVPAAHARGPWAPEMMHGRLLAGLAARTVELEHGDSELHPCRTTVDLFRSPRMAPVEVSTDVVRDGNRIRVVDVHIAIDGVEAARASVMMLRRAEQPDGEVWAPAEWDVARPEDIASPRWEGPDLPERPMAPWETRPITGAIWGANEQKRTWIRENFPLVQGEALTPYVRAAVIADFANPYANSGDRGLSFINADITLYLHRLPDGEWIGFETAGSRSADGVAVGICTLYDTGGAIGHSLVGAVANRRMGR
jgi:hypothetical protein